MTPIIDPTSHSNTLPAGKLPPALLSRLIGELPTRHPRLLLGPAVGEDAAIIDFPSEDLLVAKSDPITFATDAIGYYAVNVCANDLAVTGAMPLFYLPTLLLPAQSSNKSMIQAIFTQIAQACAPLGITVAGGHTEITPAVNQPVIAGTLLGQVPRNAQIISGGCRPGDQLILAGAVPIEGASIVARERRDALLSLGWEPADLDRAAGYLYEPGISVVQPALAAAKSGLVTAMHDPTEGGIITGIWEMAQAAGLGVTIDLDALPIDPLADRLCRAFGLDPLGTIASGALLATAHPTDTPRLIRLWDEIGWTGRAIGQITPAADGSIAILDGKIVDFPSFPTDEITKLWL
jgi:hydrogenase expression/formation protein HypE